MLKGFHGPISIKSQSNINRKPLIQFNKVQNSYPCENYYRPNNHLINENSKRLQYSRNSKRATPNRFNDRNQPDYTFGFNDYYSYQAPAQNIIINSRPLPLISPKKNLISPISSSKIKANKLFNSIRSEKHLLNSICKNYSSQKQSYMISSRFQQNLTKNQPFLKAKSLSNKNLSPLRKSYQKNIYQNKENQQRPRIISAQKNPYCLFSKILSEKNILQKQNNPRNINLNNDYYQVQTIPKNIYLQKSKQKFKRQSKLIKQKQKSIKQSIQNNKHINKNDKNALDQSLFYDIVNNSDKKQFIVSSSSNFLSMDPF